MAGIKEPRTRDPGLPAAGRRTFADDVAGALFVPRFNVIFEAAGRFPPIPARFTEAASRRCESEGAFAFALRLALSFNSTGWSFENEMVRNGR